LFATEPYPIICSFIAGAILSGRMWAREEIRLREIEVRARALGYHKIVLSAFPSNQAGLRLYEKFDFRTVGIYHEQGLIDRRWVDTIIMEKLLAER
jgi:L-amino acid N-acyltransferase YncA